MLSTERVVPGIVLVAAALLTISCQKKAAGPPPRFAVLRFENLTGDASFDWAGRGVSETLARMLDAPGAPILVGSTALARVGASLGRRPVSAPGVSAERAAALGASANRVITGYLEKSGGGLRLVTTEEDLSTHQAPRVIEVLGRTVPEVAAKAAGELVAKPAQPPTQKEEALRLWVNAVERGGPDHAAQLRKATEADPDFGPAWVSLIRTSLPADRAGATELLRAAGGRKLPPLDVAALDVIRAEMAADRKAQLQALRRYSSLLPGDVLMLRSVAEQSSAQGEFPAAAADWMKVSQALPADMNALNQAGYNYAWAGRSDEAIKAFAEYARRAPGDANAQDSLGDVHYWFGRYKEAAASYLAAHQKDQRLLAGGDLYKAAWAQYRAGDTKAAEALMDQFLKLPREAGEAGIQALHADWLYRTGRKQDAVALVRQAAESAKDPAAKALAWNQLAVWQLASGDRAGAVRSLANIGQFGTPAILTARFSAMPSASAAEWEMRADRLFAAPQIAGLRGSALAWALILDGKKAAAIAVWEKLDKQAAATDFFSHTVLAQLKGEKVPHFAAPDPRNLNQFDSILEAR